MIKNNSDYDWKKSRIMEIKKKDESINKITPNISSELKKTSIGKLENASR